MTLKQIVEMLESINIPVAYRAFEVDKHNPPPAPPFICYFFPNSDPEFADNANAAKVEELDIELYTDRKNFELENSIEEALKSNELPFSREEDRIDSEQMLQTTFITEVLINGSEQS